MAKRAIDSLLQSTSWSRATPIHKRHPPDVLAAVEADMRAVVKAGEAGSPVPSAARIASFLGEEHGVKVSGFTVARWLEKLANHEPIW